MMHIVQKVLYTWVDNIPNFRQSETLVIRQNAENIQKL